MSLAFYMDVHVPASIAAALTERGVDLLTAQKDGTTKMPDPELLDRAGFLKRVLVTQDQDFLIEAAVRRNDGRPFFGIIYVPQSGMNIGKTISDLELMAKACEPEEIENRVQFLPLR